MCMILDNYIMNFLQSVIDTHFMHIKHCLLMNYWTGSPSQFMESLGYNLVCKPIPGSHTKLIVYLFFI
jgi:hypothetical protein